MKKYLALIKFMLSALFLIPVLACDKSQPNIELIQDMMDQPSFKAQDYDPSNPSGATMRMPPEGSVPRGFKPYPFKPSEGEAAGKKLVNPYAGKITPQILARGQERYKTYCAVCHGDEGRGDGPVAAKMLVKAPPPLISELVRNYPDGRLFHIITVGQGVMGPYAGQVGTPEERWALVSYIRQKIHMMTKETK